MKKRVLVITTIVSIIVTLLMVNTAMAAQEDGNNFESVFYHETLNDKTEYLMSVILPSNNEENKKNNILTQEKVKKLIETKYSKKDLVRNIYKDDGETQLEAEENVATGYIVELTTGRKITVILYGDVNCDGKVDTNDSVTIAGYNVGLLELNDNQKKAAKLTIPSSNEISTNDTVRLAYYNVNNLAIDGAGKRIIDEELIPDDETEIIDINNFINNANSEENRFNIELVDNTMNFNLEKDKQNTAMNIPDEKIIDILTESLNNDKIKNIEISCKGNNIKLEKGENKETITNKISELLKSVLNIEVEKDNYYENIKQQLANKTLDDLLTLNIDVKINKQDTAQFAENQNGAYKIIFKGTVFLDKWIEEKKSDVESLFEATYDKENEIIKTINVKVKDRTKNISTTYGEENNKIIESLVELLNSERITTITLNYVDGGSTLTLSPKTSKDQLKSEIEKWLTENSNTIFGKELDQVIMGNLDTKEFKLFIKVGDNLKLENGDTERQYTLKFSADPITVTYNWNYKENSEQTNKTETATLEHSGVIPEDKRPKYTVLEDGATKQTDIRETEGKKYKLLGWKKDNNDEYVDFGTEVIEYDTTYTAEWIEIDDIDKKIISIVDTYNSNTSNENTGKDAFHLGYNFKESGSNVETVRVDIINTTKQISEIKNTGLMVSLLDFLTNQNISKIEVDISDEVKETFTSEQLENLDTNKLKTKIFEILCKVVKQEELRQGTITLQSLVGKSLTVKINQSDTDADYEKTYKIVFEQVISKDEIVKKVVNEDLKEASAYKYTYTDSIEGANGKISIDVLHAETELANLKDTKIMVGLQKLLTDERVEDISIVYGEDKTQSIKELLSGASDTGEMKSNITSFLSEKWSEICTCSTDCCEDGTCTWDKATNNCLIDDNTHIGMQITLSEAYEFDNKETKKAKYDLEFNRTQVELTIHYNEEEAKMNIWEGLPLTKSVSKEQVESKVPKYDRDTFRYSLKQICSDQELKKPYDFENADIVTSNLDLYADLYNVVNTNEDIMDKIKETEAEGNDHDSTIDNILREKIDEENNVTIQIEDETQPIAKIYDTALAKVLKEELHMKGVDQETLLVDEIKVKVGSNDPLTFSNSDNSSKGTIEEQLKGDAATNKLDDVVGNNLTVEVYLNKNEALTEEELNSKAISKASQVLASTSVEEPDIKINVLFEGIITKEKIKNISNTLITKNIDVNKKVKIVPREDGGFDATVQGTQGAPSDLASILKILYQIEWNQGGDLAETQAAAVAAGCGGKTALQEFFKQLSHLNSMEFSNDEKPEIGPSKLTRATATNTSDRGMGIAMQLVNIPTMLGGNTKSYMKEFDGKHLNIKLVLDENWKFEDKKMADFIMYVHVLSNTVKPSIWD